MHIRNENLHYLNGAWVPADQLYVSAFDLTFTRGYGVFDFIRSYNRQFIWLDDHIDRLYNSAQTLRIPIELSKLEMKSVFADAITHNPQGDIGIRTIRTGGISEDTLSAGHDPSLLMLVYYCPPIDPGLYESGAHFVTAVGPRQMPTIKTTNYTTSMFARYTSLPPGAFDVLLTDDSFDPAIYEGGVSSIFFVKQGVVYTTPEDKVLGGIMRKKVLAILANAGIAVRRTQLHLSEIAQVDECFATSSSIKVCPVTKINDTTIPGPGPITLKVMDEINRALQLN